MTSSAIRPDDTKPASIATPATHRPADSPLPVSISVIICTYNRKNDLRECLESLRTLKASDLEIIIVDNHSGDGTAEAIRQEYPEAILIRNPDNRGTAYSRNQGIKRARGEYVWFLDSDTIILSPDTVTHMLNYFHTHPRTGSLGGQIYKEGNTLMYWVMDENTDHKFPISEPGIHEYQLHFLPTCNLMVRKNVLKKLGGFDLHFYYYCEDLDLGLRIVNMGLTNVFRSDCCVLHKFSQKERAGEYYLFYRHVLRAYIINRTIAHLFIFPFTQTLRIVRDFVKFRKQGQRIETIKTLNDSKKQKYYTGRFGIAKLGATILWALFKACAWNTLHLPRTLYLKYHRPNYLEHVHEFD